METLKELYKRYRAVGYDLRLLKTKEYKGYTIALSINAHQVYSATVYNFENKAVNLMVLGTSPDDFELYGKQMINKELDRNEQKIRS